MSYTDPETSLTVEYGVTFFPNHQVVRNFFEQLDLPVDASFWTLRMEYFDFRTGEPIVMETTEREKALETYRSKTQEYPFLRRGLYLPDPVPEDLLLPFEQFVDKYRLRHLLLSVGGMNFLGDWMHQPTLHIMEFFNLDFLDGLKDGFLKPGNNGNSAIYTAAERKLGDKVLLNSTVVRKDRDSSPDWVYIEVRTGSQTRLIRAKRLISAVPPLPATLAGFDLSHEETRLFTQFRHTYCYTAVVRTTKLPPDMCYLNRAAGFTHPRLPSVLTIRPSPVPDLRTLHIGSHCALSEEDVKCETISSFRSLQLADPQVLAVGNHSPYQLIVPAEAIAKGFYRELNALQGVRRTYYIGAAFDSHNSRQIWDLVDHLLETEILPSLEKAA